MMYITPTPAQHALLNCGDYEVNLWSAQMYMERMGLTDIDAAFVAICAAQEQQRKFNRTPLVRVNTAYRRKEQDYRMLVGE